MKLLNPIRVMLLLFILFFSCDSKNTLPIKADGQVQVIVNGTSHNFEINQDGIDNNGFIYIDSDDKKRMSLTAVDAKTIDNDLDQQFRIVIDIEGSIVDIYSFHIPDEDFPKATMTINMPGNHLNDFPDYISYEVGGVTITKIEDVGRYIWGVFEGEFKDTQIGNGLPFQDMPITTIRGAFQIYRSN